MISACCIFSHITREMEHNTWSRSAEDSRFWSSHPPAVTAQLLVDHVVLGERLYGYLSGCSDEVLLHMKSVCGGLRQAMEAPQKLEEVTDIAQCVPMEESGFAASFIEPVLRGEVPNPRLTCEVLLGSAGDVSSPPSLFFGTGATTTLLNKVRTCGGLLASAQQQKVSHSEAEAPAVKPRRMLSLAQSPTRRIATSVPAPLLSLTPSLPSMVEDAGVLAAPSSMNAQAAARCLFFAHQPLPFGVRSREEMLRLAAEESNVQLQSTLVRGEATSKIAAPAWANNAAHGGSPSASTSDEEAEVQSSKQDHGEHNDVPAAPTSPSTAATTNVHRWGREDGELFLQGGRVIVRPVKQRKHAKTEKEEATGHSQVEGQGTEAVGDGKGDASPGTTSNAARKPTATKRERASEKHKNKKNAQGDSRGAQKVAAVSISQTPLRSTEDLRELVSSLPISDTLRAAFLIGLEGPPPEERPTLSLAAPPTRLTANHTEEEVVEENGSNSSRAEVPPRAEVGGSEE